MIGNALRIIGGALFGYFYGDQGIGQSEKGVTFGQIGFFAIIILVGFLIFENFKRKWDTV